MTLPIETAAVGDQYARRALDKIAQEFPLHANITDFAQMPGATISSTANQSITNNTATKATFDTTVWSNPGVTIDLANERLTVTVPGKYYVFGQASFTKDLSTRLMDTEATIRKNAADSADSPRQGVHSPNGLAQGMHMSVTAVMNLAVNDTLELWVIQINDGAVAQNLLGTTADSSRAKLGCHWLGP